MKIIDPSVTIMTDINTQAVYSFLEECGRVCYKSEAKITQDSAEKFLRGIIRSGHESVLEHQSITVKFVCDRGVSHEINTDKIPGRVGEHIVNDFMQLLCEQGYAEKQEDAG